MTVLDAVLLLLKGKYSGRKLFMGTGRVTDMFNRRTAVSYTHLHAPNAEIATTASVIATVIQGALVATSTMASRPKK